MKAFLLLYPAAIKKIEKETPIPKLPIEIDEIIVIWPNASIGQVGISHETISKIEKIFGRKTILWNFPLSGQEQQSVYSKVSKDARDGVEAWENLLGEEKESLNWAKSKANDQVMNRTWWMETAKRSILKAIKEDSNSTILLPWISRKFGMVERPGLLGLDASAHSLYFFIQELRQTNKIIELWPSGIFKEKFSILLQPIFMFILRLAILFGRSIRDFFTSFQPRKNSNKPVLALIVGGKSCWESLRHLRNKLKTEFEFLIVQDDIFKNPSSYRALKSAGENFFPIHKTVSPLHFIFLLPLLCGQYCLKRFKLEKLKNKTELYWQLKLDLQSLPELFFFSYELKTIVKKFRVRGLVSANIIDSFLSVASEIGKRLSIPHFCIQNGSLPKLEMPYFADCDLYFAQPKSLRDFFQKCNPDTPAVSVGLPYLDELLLKKNSNSNSEILKKYPYLKGRLLITIATQAECFDSRELLKELINRFNGKQNQIGFLLKLHPREDTDRYVEVSKKLNDENLGAVFHLEDFSDILSVSDILVTSFSAVVMWALAFGVMPLTLVPNYLDFYTETMDYMNPEISRKFESQQALVNFIEEILMNPGLIREWQKKRDLTLDQYLTGCDGHATQRIAEIIKTKVKFGEQQHR